MVRPRKLIILRDYTSVTQYNIHKNWDVAHKNVNPEGTNFTKETSF